MLCGEGLIHIKSETIVDASGDGEERRRRGTLLEVIDLASNFKDKKIDPNVSSAHYNRPQDHSAMSSFWQSVKNAASNAGAATSRAARKTKLQGEVMMAKQKVKGMQERFGVAAYPSLVKEDHAAVQSILAEFKPQIDAVEMEIQNKENLIAAIDKEAADSAAASGGSESAGPKDGGATATATGGEPKTASTTDL